MTNARTTPTTPTLLNDLIKNKQGKQAFYVLMGIKGKNPKGFENMMRVEFGDKLRLTS